LVKKEVSADFVSEVLEQPVEEIRAFISTYSSWFNSPENGKYQLYHERLKVYLLQKLSDKEIKAYFSCFLSFESKKDISNELRTYTAEWSGYYSLLNGYIEQGLLFLKSSISKQKENWWVNTFDLYCSMAFSSSDYQISEIDLDFYANLKDREHCISAAKIVTSCFEHIPWEEFGTLREARFHYVLAEVLIIRFYDIPEHTIYRLILEESHYLSYVLAYAWKYNCWLNEEMPFPELVAKIKLKGSPYLRILLRQIDGGRIMLNKTPILCETDYDDCWEYVEEGFLDYIRVGKEKILENYFGDHDFYYCAQKSGLSFILDEFDSLHIQKERIQRQKTTIQKASCFFKLIEILWLHPAWEIGEIGNDFVRQKLINTKEKSELDDFTNWIYTIAKDQSHYSIASLIFDIMEVADISDQYVVEIIASILDLNDAQIRGQFITSANEFFVSNMDDRWFTLFKVQLIHFCELATDIWETQALIDLFDTLKDRFTETEITHYINLHKILQKIPNARELDWIDFWRIAESMRLNGEI
jgi:hypothetical protein